MNYKGHVVVNSVVLAGVMYFSKNYVRTMDQIYFSTGYVFATFFLSPDLDLFYSQANKNWKFLRVLWWPYAKIMKHRGLSHSLLLASFSKLIYITVISLLMYLSFILIMVYVSHGNFSNSDQHLYFGVLEFRREFFGLFLRHWLMIRYVLLGVWLSDIAHILVGDRMTSALKIILKP